MFFANLIEAEAKNFFKNKKVLDDEYNSFRSSFSNTENQSSIYSNYPFQEEVLGLGTSTIPSSAHTSCFDEAKTLNF